MLLNEPFSTGFCRCWGPGFPGELFLVSTVPCPQSIDFNCLCCSSRDWHAGSNEPIASRSGLCCGRFAAIGNGGSLSEGAKGAVDYPGNIWVKEGFSTTRCNRWAFVYTIHFFKGIVSFQPLTPTLWEGFMTRISCPRCHCEKLYRMSTGKRRCSHCRYDFRPRRLPLYLTRDQWKAINTWFVLEQRSQTFTDRARIDRLRVLRALTWIRRALVKDVPEVFSGIFEVDETYVGGYWKN